MFSVWSLEKSFFRELVPVSDSYADDVRSEGKNSLVENVKDGIVVPIVFPDYVKCQSRDGCEYILELSRNGWGPLSVVYKPCFSSCPAEYLTGRTRFGLFNDKEGYRFDVPYPAWVCLQDKRINEGSPVYFSRSKSNVEFFYFAENITMFSCKFSLGEMHELQTGISVKRLDLRAICYWKEKKIEIVSWVDD